jgi:hypothetical protein
MLHFLFDQAVQRAAASPSPSPIPSFKQASFFSFSSDQAENRKSSGQIAEILQLHITVNPECAQSRQFHILFSQRKHSGILNK